MNPLVRDLWADRLESGTRLQGVGWLRYTAVEEGKFHGTIRYCCLGVLCELAQEAGIVSAVPDGTLTIFRSVDVYEDRSRIELPACVQRWAELPAGQKIIFGGSLCSFAELNDGLRVPFPEIGGLVRAQL